LSAVSVGGVRPKDLNANMSIPIRHRNSLPSGYRLAEFRIQSILGHGGFGITYRARDEDLHQDVAIKEYLPREVATRVEDSTVVPISEGDRETFEWGLDRFLEEARTLARFKHPNIIGVRRFLRANGTAYLVMDYCEGESLESVLAGEARLPSDRLMAMLDPLLDALEVLHTTGVTHRDIKPGNIYLKADGSPLLLDFGAARQALAQHSRSVTAMATPGYAAFEQYSTNGKQGPWTDIYGLGATLYRCVTGQRPPDASDRMLEDELEPAASAASGYPRALLEQIDAALRVKPDERPQSVPDWRFSNAPRPLPPAKGKNEGEPTAPSPRQSSFRSRHKTTANIFLGIALFAISSFLSYVSVVVFHDPGSPVGSRSASAPVASTPAPATPRPEVRPSTGTVHRDRLQDGTQGPEMVFIRGGTFTMGSPANAARRRSDERQHRVSIGDVWIGRYEVTFDEYDRFARATGRDLPDDQGWGRGRRPVINVNWHDATAYAEWLSQQTGQRYRLPTEAEWEYAARAGTTTARFWGNDPDAACQFANVHDETAERVNGDFRRESHGCDDRHPQTAPVGSFAPNAWGLYDMMGNVYEWTCSAFDADYGGAEQRCDRSGENRAIRGGSWFNGPDGVRSAYRIRLPPRAGYHDRGLRLARSP
jgi:formylglycine-generating enzyme required for sulfatase activity